MIYATTGLVDGMLTMACEEDPESVSMLLAVTPASDLSDLDLPPETPVFTHFLLPDVGASLAAVVGVDLATAGIRTQGRFVSHTDGRLKLSVTDDLHEVVFVAVPPWDRESTAAFDRRGRRLSLELVTAEPPDETIE